MTFYNKTGLVDGENVYPGFGKALDTISHKTLSEKVMSVGWMICQVD